MLEYDVARAKKAVQYLVDTPYFAKCVTKLRNTVKRPRSMPFSGELEVLHELLVVGRQNIEAMEKLIALAEFKRDDHREYQRKYMAAKRARERLVIAIQQNIHGVIYAPEGRRMVLEEQYAIWSQEKEDHMAACRAAYMNEFHTEPGWEQRNQFSRDFWAIKDMELNMLDEQERAMRKKIAVPKKRAVQVAAPQKPKNSIVAQKLMDALAKRK